MIYKAWYVRSQISWTDGLIEHRDTSVTIIPHTRVSWQCHHDGNALVELVTWNKRVLIGKFKTRLVRLRFSKQCFYFSK